MRVAFSIDGTRRESFIGKSFPAFFPLVFLRPTVVSRCPAGSAIGSLDMRFSPRSRVGGAPQQACRGVRRAFLLDRTEGLKRVFFGLFSTYGFSW